MDSFLRSNNLVRLIAFVLAVMLWLVVKVGTGTTETPAQIDRVTEVITGQVNLQLDKDRMSLVGDPPEVSVKISGDRLAVWQAKVQSGKLTFMADVRGLTEGVHEVPVQVQGLPPGVTFEPINASVRLEANLVQAFPVDLTVDGVQDAAKMAYVFVEPKQVVLTGPASVLGQVQKVQARMVPQIFDTPGEKRTVVVSAVNEGGKPVHLTIQPKTVDITYRPPVETRVFSKLQTEVKGLDKDLKLSLPKDGISLTLSGAPADLGVVKPEDIKIVIDVTGLTPGSYQREAVITLPKNVNLVDKTPILVSVTIEKKE